MEMPTYHIIWTTYGTWLPGDARGWIKSGTWTIQAGDRVLEEENRARMAGDAVVLDLEHRDIVEQTIRDHCAIRNWNLHAMNVRTNHVHLVVTADRDPDTVMEQLKAWCSRKLSDAKGATTRIAKNAGRKRWFTEGGDKEIIQDDAHFHNTIRYVLEGQ